MKVYKGARSDGGPMVWVDEYCRNDVGSVVCRTGELSPCREGRDYAAGFEWGYCGSGPAQLAFALLMDTTNGDRATATAWTTVFMQQYVSQWGKRFSVSQETLLAWLDYQRQRQLVDATCERLLSNEEENEAHERSHG
jgi:hypothetical protein